MRILSKLPADAQARIEMVKFEAAEKRRQAIDLARAQLAPSPEKDYLGADFPREARMGNFQFMLICTYTNYLASVFFAIVEELQKIKGDDLGVEELNRFLELRDETYQEWVESAGNPGNQGLFNEVAVGAVERDTRYKDQLRTMADSHADDATKPKASITGRLAKDTRVRSGTGGFNQKPEIPSSADEGELWSTLDHRFVTLKLKTPTERRRRELEEEIAQARLKHILNRYEAAFPSAWIEAYIRYLEGLLEDRYRVSCEVWQEQGNPLSPQFLREVFTKGIEVTIELLGEHFREEFRRQFGAIKNRPDSDPILQSGRGRMNEAKQRLRNNWYIRTELEARELEYAIARRERTPMGSQTPETAPEAAPEPEQARAAVTATTGEPSTGTAPEDSQRNGTEQQDATTPKREFTCSPDYRSGSLPENDAGLCG